MLGIATDEADYRLCWLINNRYGTNFERIDDLELYYRRSDANQLFSIFHYFDDDSLLTYRIIRNRAENGGYFLEELKNLDYLVHIQGEIFPDEISNFIDQLGQLAEIRFCIPVDLGKIREKVRLQLW